MYTPLVVSSLREVHSRPCFVGADALVGVIWQTTMGGGSGRHGRCLAHGKGPQAEPTSIRYITGLALEFDPTVLVINREAPRCGGDHPVHPAVLERLSTSSAPS